MLNLWCSDGMRCVKMTDVQRVRFLNAVLDSEFKKALETLALSHDTQKKAVSINFVGEGKRRGAVGYVIENPIWKTSYRLVLDKKEEKPYLQGWAVVENPTDEDWKDVRMALVSGRPISFQMDLYQPLYVRRPWSSRNSSHRCGPSPTPAAWNEDREAASGARGSLRRPRRRNGAGCNQQLADGERHAVTGDDDRAARATAEDTRRRPAPMGSSEERLEETSGPRQERRHPPPRRPSWATSSSMRSTSR